MRRSAAQNPMIAPDRMMEIKDLLRCARTCATLTAPERHFLDTLRDRIAQDGADVAFTNAALRVLRSIEDKVHA
jgi:hypothetical protein